MSRFSKLEIKYGRYAIRNLMYYIIILYTIGFLLDLFAPSVYYNYLALDVSMILKGQIWRIITFIIATPDTSPFFIIFTLYLYYMIGTSLERMWGAFKFNVYFFMGVFLHVVAAFIIYFVWGIIFYLDTYYLNLSLYLAFAAIFPEMEFMVFFVLPVKVKWLGIIDGIFFALTVVFGFLFPILFTKIPNIYYGLTRLGIIAIPQYATAALVSMLNFLIFFAITRNAYRLSPKEVKRKIEYKKKVKQVTYRGSRHKCAICGQTEANEALSFRYCSKCNGNYEYCQEHLYTHQHIQ